MKERGRDFGFARAEDSTGFLLWQVTNLWQREIKKALEPYGLTHAQFVLLASIHWLNGQQGDVTQVVLAAHTRMDPMTTSTVLRTLQTKDLIQRHEHATDTRAKMVALTSGGLRVTQQAIQTVEKFDQTFFGSLGPQQEGFDHQLRALHYQLPGL